MHTHWDFDGSDELLVGQVNLISAFLIAQSKSSAMNRTYLFSITIHPHTFNWINWQPQKFSDRTAKKMAYFHVKERSDFFPFLVIQYG